MTTYKNISMCYPYLLRGKANIIHRLPDVQVRLNAFFISFGTPVLFSSFHDTIPNNLSILMHLCMTLNYSTLKLEMVNLI